ncbi:hypothetical protein chiPu_0028295 [Chiloscyllium punctatum]|uniref:Uncharacterized protein n=1 Tax=Chiloscyllium punctatum TaxID=137246 RepID=A0A401TNA0_CHIPU|nr:hypothetical protein [Chiloscyllium punctatum]
MTRPCQKNRSRARKRKARSFTAASAGAGRGDNVFPSAERPEERGENSERVQRRFTKADTTGPRSDGLSVLPRKPKYFGVDIAGDGRGGAWGKDR